MELLAIVYGRGPNVQCVYSFKYNRHGARFDTSQYGVFSGSRACFLTAHKSYRKRYQSGNKTSKLGTDAGKVDSPTRTLPCVV